MAHNANFSKYGHNDFYCALGYKSEVIKEYFYKQKILNSDFTIDLSNGQIDYHKIGINKLESYPNKYWNKFNDRRPC